MLASGLAGAGEPEDPAAATGFDRGLLIGVVRDLVGDDHRRNYQAADRDAGQPGSKRPVPLSTRRAGPVSSPDCSCCSSSIFNLQLRQRRTSMPFRSTRQYGPARYTAEHRAPSPVMKPRSKDAKSGYEACKIVVVNLRNKSRNHEKEHRGGINTTMARPKLVQRGVILRATEGLRRAPLPASRPRTGPVRQVGGNQWSRSMRPRSGVERRTRTP